MSNQEMEKLFERFKRFELRSSNLKGIVQNAGMTVEDEELSEWCMEVEKTISHLLDLKKDVVNFYKGEGW
ncbi:hypothetical protein IEN91_05280 [Bacillus velezensis]|uniref:hypothetical protein n=1 Tax=Bacillus velezensis TaxID=492670 RepID=UPI0018C4701F|nr:hypothetical protein [Bacillus velezensis]QPK89851.1 hypothetical protein IEN91_05280 [Bacillus velezensis]